MRRTNKPIQEETRNTTQVRFEVERIFKMESDKNLKAFIDIKVNNTVLIKGIRVLLNREGGLFVSMPSQKAADNKYYPIVRPLDNETKEELQNVILAAYNS